MKKGRFFLRAAVLLLLVMFFPLWGTVGQLWADQVTAEQARQQAQAFLNSRIAAGGGPRHAPGTTPQLMQERLANGLYVFNVSNDGGFVIVSNDDRTVPVLGFGDNGNIDPANMPDNMRAWLQGYADEIAWLNEYTAATPGAAKAPRRTPAKAKTAVAPLLTTTWNQGPPYNNRTPYYGISGGNYVFSTDQTPTNITWDHCATGCVATAMAQVMNYHKWPQNSLPEIPGYRWANYNNTLNVLPQIEFSWNLSNSYASDATGTSANAVAYLMQYCGWSVQMNYGPSSGSNTDKVAYALKQYFDYKNTTQFVSRSFYTYDKWVNLMYHELEHRRPVVYGGMSSGGGHEFVCDGYKYQNGTDYFHINWGWGGLSDEYYVLSALNPYSQGIGGSSSNDGFHYGQDAVIGIQPSTGIGTIATIEPNVINLKVNSMTPSSNPAIVGKPLNITLNITNNSADDYDGDIYLGLKYGEGSYDILDGKTFLIPAGETKNIVLPFNPDATGTYEFIYWLPNDMGSYSTNGQVYATVEVISAATNEYVPIYGYYCDQYSRSQFIIPETNLTYLCPSYLNGMTFYANTQTAIDWNAEFDVYLSEVEEATFANTTLKDWSTLKKVYSGKLSVGNDGKMVINFDNPYRYNGGNLLVGINQTKQGDDYIRSNWIGTNINGVSLGGYNDDIQQRNFLPMTTFDYAEAPALAVPKDIAIVPGTTTADVTWTGNEEATGYNLRYRAVKDITYDFESAEPWAVDDFAPFTTYDGDKKNTYTIQGSEFNNQGYKGSVIAFQNGKVNGFAAHGGNAFGCFMDINGQNNDWFISPEVTVTEGMVFSFWARSYTSSYGLERFKVGIYGSTAGTFASFLAGDATSYVEAPTAWTKYEYDLSPYAGQTIKLAINCVSNDAFAFFIDDIYIGDPNASWETIAVGTSSQYQLTGLAAETTYELQIQAVYSEGTSDWSNVQPFTTGKIIELADDGAANSDILEEYDRQTVCIALTGRTLYKDGAWNTLCLPFDVTLADSPLSGATAKTLTDATMNNTHVTLTFGEAVDVLEAGVPYIIKWEGDGTDNIENPVFNGVTVVNRSDAERTIEKADGNVKFIGYYDAMTINTPANDDIYYMTAANTLKHTGKQRTLKACRAYFKFSNEAVSGSRRIVLDFGDETTGIHELVAPNSQLSAPNSLWYTIDGRRIEGVPTQKGLYINGNKKIIVK